MPTAEYQREWRRKNPDKTSQYYHAKKARDPDYYKNAAKKHNESYPDKKKKRNKNWRLNNPDYRNEYYKKHKK